MSRRMRWLLGMGGVLLALAVVLFVPTLTEARTIKAAGLTFAMQQSTPVLDHTGANPIVLSADGDPLTTVKLYKSDMVTGESTLVFEGASVRERTITVAHNGYTMTVKWNGQFFTITSAPGWTYDSGW